MPPKFRMEVSPFSGDTIYYLVRQVDSDPPVYLLSHSVRLSIKVFIGMSLAGSFLTPAFNSFHLLQLIRNNQLLGRVIRAITMNGDFLLLFLPSTILNIPLCQYSTCSETVNANWHLGVNHNLPACVGRISYASTLLPTKQFVLRLPNPVQFDHIERRTFVFHQGNSKYRPGSISRDKNKLVCQHS